MTPVNDLPVVVDDIGTTPEDTALFGNILTNDSDVEGVLTVTQFSVGGRVSDHELQLDTATGHLSQPTALGDRSLNDTIAPIFSQQLNEASRTERLDRLERALGFR